jgi:CBS domain containing-hemolysin-like protein
VTTIIIIAGLTLLASFLCSLFEAVLYSLTPAQVSVLKQSGSRTSKQLAGLRDDVEEPIAAILTVNTIAHTVGSAWCGAMVAEIWGSQAVGIFAAIFTFLVLAVTEIIPKSIGVRYADKLALSVVLPIRMMIWLVWPIVFVAKKAMRFVSGPAKAYSPSEAEVVATARSAALGGTMRDEEHRWIKNMVRLDKTLSGSLRTPRTVVESLPADTAIADLVQHAERWLHSRVPITEGSDLDKVIGLVYRREVFDAALTRPDANLSLRDLMHPISFVPESLPAHHLLKQFLRSHTHMVAVADEYGGFEGVVTLEDVLECLIGDEIVDEHDETTDMQLLARQNTRADIGTPRSESETSESKPDESGND